MLERKPRKVVTIALANRTAHRLDTDDEERDLPGFRRLKEAKEGKPSAMTGAPQGGHEPWQAPLPAVPTARGDRTPRHEGHHRSGGSPASEARQTKKVPFAFTLNGTLTPISSPSRPFTSAWSTLSISIEVIAPCLSSAAAPAGRITRKSPGTKRPSGQAKQAT